MAQKLTAYDRIVARLYDSEQLYSAEIDRLDILLQAVPGFLAGEVTKDALEKALNAFFVDQDFIEEE